MKFLTLNSLFASVGVVCFAAAAVIESISADTIMPLLTLFGAVAVGTFYALKAPENARRKSQFDDATDHIAWLNNTLSRTRNTLSRAQARLAEHGIRCVEAEDDEQPARGENPRPNEGKENDKNIVR